jgi:hypothetical protein
MKWPLLLPKSLTSRSEQLIHGVGRPGTSVMTRSGTPLASSNLAHPCRKSCSRSQFRPARRRSSSQRRFTLRGSTGVPMDEANTSRAPAMPRLAPSARPAVSCAPGGGALRVKTGHQRQDVQSLQPIAADHLEQAAPLRGAGLCALGRPPGAPAPSQPMRHHRSDGANRHTGPVQHPGRLPRAPLSAPSRRV